ncbi:uncharacterized protein [Chelonus insularis]|uniref:uncharacterized protein n=1 Tax=Chelonus insularis TaxID=460826 RepID=UPI0015883E37|nr:uncharacterized protein LOC118072193 [Chelonus insularis]
MGDQDNNSSIMPAQALIFKTAISNVIKNIVESVSDEEFKEYFSFLNMKSTTSKRLYDALVNDLHKEMNLDLDSIVTEDNLVDGITEITRLTEICTQKPNTPAWRPPGEVKKHLRTFDMIQMQNEYEKLRKIAEEVKTEKDSLLKEVTQRREMTRKVEKNIDESIQSGLSTIAQMKRSADLLRECHSLVDNL